MSYQVVQFVDSMHDFCFRLTGGFEMRMFLAIGFLCLSSLPTFSQAVSNLPSPGPQNRRITHNNDGSLTATVFTYGYTPLFDAIVTINEEYGWNINYEDAPTVNASELVDNDAEFHRTHPGFHEDIQDGYVRKVQPFRSSFIELDAHHADQGRVLEQIVHDYNASENPGKFRLDRTKQGGYIVVGARYRSESGAEVEYTPILNCSISLDIPRSSLHDALGLVADQVNKTCSNNLHAELSAKFAAQESGPRTGGNVFGNFRQEATRDIVESLLSQELGLMSYSVNYMPGINKFYLVTWLAHRKIVGADGNEILDPVLKSQVGDR
jgi:hypothetical protein